MAKGKAKVVLVSVATMGLILSNLVRSPCGCVTLAGEVSKAHYHNECMVPGRQLIQQVYLYDCLA